MLERDHIQWTSTWGEGWAKVDMGEEGLKLPEFFVDVIYGWLVEELQIVGGSTFGASERLRVCGSVLNLRRRRPVSTRGYGTPPPPGWAGEPAPAPL